MNTFFNKLNGTLVELSIFTENDITDDYLAWLNDSIVMKFSNQRFLNHDIASSKKYFLSFKNTDNLFILIRTKDEGKSIGTMTAYFNFNHGVVDLGILIGNTSVWGKGYGQDAWNTLTSWALDLDAIRKITAGTLSCNFGMLKIFERSGMSLEAAKKKQEVIDSVEFDVHYFCKFKGE